MNKQINMVGGKEVFVHSGDVAQLGEHLPCKQDVVGSIPTISTNNDHFKLSLTKGTKWLKYGLVAVGYEVELKDLR